MEKQDYYKVLGISKNANDEDIKRAYRQLAKKYHPDLNPGDKVSESKFKEINEACQILSDPEKRAYYDQYGHVGPGAEYSGSGTDFGFGGFSEVFENIFDDFFGGATTRNTQSEERGSDLRYDLQISFMDAAHGVEKTIEIPRLEICSNCQGSGSKHGTGTKSCPKCSGRGQVRYSQGFFSISKTCDKCRGEGVIIESPCDKCRGQGRIKQERKIVLKVPAGVRTGSHIKLAREGESGRRGGSPGDLYVVLHVDTHPFFQRDENNIICEMPVTFLQAILGDVIEVPGIDGINELKIPQGTQSGSILKLKGKGFPNINGYNRGDQLIKITVEIPTNLNERQKDLLRQFAQISTDDIHPIKKTFLKRIKEFFK